MEDNNKDLKVIDVFDLVKKMWANKKLYTKTLPIAFVISCIYILGFPRYYSTEIKLAPELGGSSMVSTLGSLASSLGFDLNELESNDAITPLLYPDLMEDNGFVTSLFNVKVTSKDGSINTTYHDYLQKYQKPIIWLVPIDWVKNLFKKEGEKGAAGGSDPYFLSKKEDEIAKIIRGKINISFDKKTAVICISVQDQDALICKTIGDSVKTRLQDFITEYRTNKARIDYDYYLKLTMEAKQDYERARQEYGRTADANSSVALKSVELKLEDMENDLQLRFNSYSAVNSQMQVAKAKVQECTPAFTVIKGASVPVKPSGPKRMFFVLAMLFLTTLGTSFYIVVRKYNFQ